MTMTHGTLSFCMVTGVMKRVLRSGMGPTIQEYMTSMKEEEARKPDAEQRRFEEDDIQMACMSDL